MTSFRMSVTVLAVMHAVFAGTSSRPETASPIGTNSPRLMVLRYSLWSRRIRPGQAVLIFFNSRRMRR